MTVHTIRTKHCTPTRANERSVSVSKLCLTKVAEIKLRARAQVLALEQVVCSSSCFFRFFFQVFHATPSELRLVSEEAQKQVVFSASFSLSFSVLVLHGAPSCTRSLLSQTTVTYCRQRSGFASSFQNLPKVGWFAKALATIGRTPSSSGFKAWPSFQDHSRDESCSRLQERNEIPAR